MILKTDDTINIIDGDSFGEVIESKINDKKLSKLFGLLSGLYKNIYESVVREYSANMIDSHQEAGKQDTPALITLEYKDDNYSLIFQDFGVGMSVETMQKVYFNYLDSTKEESNESLGA
jgi:DNA topoisomerase VI subunit B